MTASRSIHQVAADLLAEKWSQAAPGARRLALSYLMTRDERIEHHVAVFGQPYGDWSMGQLFALYCLAKIYSNGNLAVAQFNLPGVPARDHRRIQNQQVLNGLPSGVTAEVNIEQRGAEGDGSVEWTRPIPGIIEPHERKRHILMKPGSVPLEIGYTDTNTTCFHLIGSGGVARWPYGHSAMTILTDYPENTVLKWRYNPPDDPILSDFAEFANRLALTRLAPSISWGARETRPSAEERLRNAFNSFRGLPSPKDSSATRSRREES